MKRVKIFDFDLEKVSMADIETQLNTYIDDLTKSNTSATYQMISLGYLKFWRIIIYF